MIFLDVLILLTFVWFSRKLFQFIHFPPLFGEVFAGVLAGPLILGIVQDSAELQLLAELGIFFLMFHAGLETHPQEFLRSSKIAIPVALGGVVLTFLSSFWLSWMFGYSTEVSTFIGLALSVTAVAILARLFKDAKISGTKVAHISMAAAIVTEILMLVFLSIFLDIAETGNLQWDHLAFLLVKVVGYFAVVLTVGHTLFPFMYRILYKGNKGFTFSLILALAFGVVAELLGLHMIIGAYLAGLFLQQEVLDPEVYHKIEDRTFGLSYSFLGPIFFATLAFHLDLSAFTTDFLFVILLLLVALLGKLFGSGLAARISGMDWCDSLGVGLAMNSRGAVELIIISLGYQAGIIDERVFSVLVIIAFASVLISIIALKPLAPTIRDKQCRMSFKERLLKIVT